ncbi:MAG: hypothetical protein BWY74_01912 [Firmicutes bacterium ADurb.Bin419]|nr:MAG: hypothetical protein BWY74_01912 [Firmicutes bacterium ADurb.Bin419]
MAFMKNILDFKDYKSRIIGYFKIRTQRIKDINVQQLYQKFSKRAFVIPEFPPGDINLWIRYQAHIFLMDEFKSDQDLFYRLFVELVYTYNDFYKRAEFEHYKQYYPEQLFFNVEDFSAPLRTLVTETGYPNRTLCYCYKYLLSDWTSQRIAVELSNTELDELLNRFCSQYVEESGMHKLFVDYMFLPLRKGLNETLDYYIQQYGNDDEKFLRIIKQILFVRTGSTKLENYFGANEIQRRSHMISVWCNRIKSSIIKNTIRFLKVQNYYCNQERKI